METLQSLKDAKYVTTTAKLTVDIGTEFSIGMLPVAGRKIAVKVNGTVYGASTTASDGTFSGTLTLPAVDDKPTNYQIEIVFYGDNGFNLTGYAYAPDNTRYAVCSTVQYFPYKPASNSTFVTVDPHSVQIMLATKTPEELQEEAKGSLRTEPRFSLWFPWFRLHTMYLLDAQQQFDVGIGLFGSNIMTASQQFLDRLAEYLKDIAMDVFVDYILGELVAMVGAMSGNPIWWGIGLGFSVFIRSALLYVNWNSIPALRTSYWAQWISIMIEVGSFIKELSYGSLLKVAQGLTKITTIAWNILTIFANVIIDIVGFIFVIDGRLAQLGGR